MNKVDELVDILSLLYGHGWDERNGGNVSFIIDEVEAKKIAPSLQELREIKYKYDFASLVGKYLLVTGSGKYFKNAKKEPEKTIGLLKVKDKNTLSLLWGYSDGGTPTSELPTHLQSHTARLAVSNNHRVVMHCHPTNIIAMTHICPLTDNFFTETLWKMQTESIVVFPEGVSVLPWMVCGGEEIGNATAAKMKDFRSVIWSHHGLFCTGTDLDETFGLVETIEKAAEIYMKIVGHPIKQSITNKS